MRLAAAIVLATMFALPAGARAQVNTSKGASLEARRANQYYKAGGEAMHRESWDDAGKQFQAAIDTDDKFALAYYARAHQEENGNALKTGRHTEITRTGVRRESGAPPACHVFS